MTQTLNYTIGADRRAFVKDIQNFKIDFADDNNNWVQARQFERGMRQVFVNILNEDHTPFDMTGCNVWFEGLLPENAKGDFRVIDHTGFVPIDLQNGQFRFDLPGHAFTVAGSYRQAFFRIVKNGQSVTTLEFDLQVLADKVIGGLVPRTYISPLEQILEEVEADFAEHTKKFDDINADFKVKVTNLFDQLSKQGTETANMLTTVQARLGEIEEKIKQDGLFTEEEAKQLENRLALKLSTGFEHTYGTVDEMLSDQNLGAGMYARTAGYYAANDGGGADYLITSKTPLNYSETLKNGLFAQLLYESEPVNVLTFGVKNDGTQDSSEIINEQTKLHALYLPAGKYLVNNQLDIYHNLLGETGPVGMSKDEKGLTTLVSGIDCESNDAQQVATSLICNHGSSAIIQNLNIKLNTSENGITDNGFYVTKIENVFIYNLQQACGVKIDRHGSRASIIENLFIESSHDSVYDNIGLYYLTGTDEILTNYWSMGCQVGIHATVCLFYGNNIHIWCGSVAKNLSAEWWAGSNGLFLQSSFAYLTNLYLDTMRYGILTNDHSIASIKNVIVNFDDSVIQIKDQIGAIELAHSGDNDFVEFNGGSIYSDRYSGVMTFDEFRKALIKNVVVQVDVKDKGDYLSDHYRYIMPNMAWGYDHEYMVSYPTEKKGNYGEIARMPIGATSSGDIKLFISDLYNGAVEALIQVADGQVKSTNTGSGTNLTLAYKVVNNWLILYAQMLDGYNSFSVTAEGNNTFSLVNYNYLRTVGQQVFEKLHQNDDTGLTKVPSDGSWVSPTPVNVQLQ